VDQNSAINNENVSLIAKSLKINFKIMGILFVNEIDCSSEYDAVREVRNTYISTTKQNNDC
jgi:hypothetical protein